MEDFASDLSLSLTSGFGAAFVGVLAAAALAGSTDLEGVFAAAADGCGFLASIFSTLAGDLAGAGETLFYFYAAGALEGFTGEAGSAGSLTGDVG